MNFGLFGQQPHEFFNFSQTGFQYIGVDKVAQRKTYVIRRGTESYYYFDKEKFLLLKWGREESLGGQKLEVSYVANSFKRWGTPRDTFLLPSQISIVAGDKVLGSYRIEGIEINRPVKQSVFTPPGI